MYSDKNVGKGTCRLFWRDIRDSVALFDPKCVELIDEIDPNDSFSLYECYYPYGELIGDQHDMYFPMLNGQMLSLRDHNIPATMKKELGYGTENSPLCMILSKNAEYFIYLPYAKKKLFGSIYKPGTMFPYQRVLNLELPKQYAPNSLTLLRSGAQTIFTLPGMGALDHYDRLIEAFELRTPFSKNYCDQFNVFNEIFQSDFHSEKWFTRLVYFSEPWAVHLHTDPAWIKLRNHLQQKVLRGSEFSRNKKIYDLAYNELLRTHQEKPNSFLMDLVKYVIDISAGVTPGFAPAVDDEIIPAKFFVKILSEIYRPDKFPTMMVPTYFDPTHGSPVYASLQALWHTSLAPNTSNSDSSATQLKKFVRLFEMVQQGFSGEGMFCADTALGDILRAIQVQCFHGNSVGHQIQPSSLLPKIDDRFTQRPSGLLVPESLQFAENSPFFTGCIQIKKIVQQFQL